MQLPDFRVLSDWLSEPSPVGSLSVLNGARMRRSLHARERTKNGPSSVETINGRETWETAQIVSERLDVKLSGPNYIDSLDESKSRCDCPARASFYIFSGSTDRRVEISRSLSWR